MSAEVILHCFQKCGFKESEISCISEDSEIDEEFESLPTQLREDDDITVEDFISFDDNLTTSIGQINTDLIDWRQQAREEAIQQVLPDPSDSSHTENEEVASEDDEEENIPQQLSPSKALQHLEELLNFSMNQNDETLTGLH